MAVQIICYELKIYVDRKNTPKDIDSSNLATSEELEGFHKHLEGLLEHSGFMKKERSKQLKLRLRRLFNRVILKKQEINILRGILVSLDARNKLKK